MTSDFKPGDLVRKRKYSQSRFGDLKENHDVGIVIEFKKSNRMSDTSRALVYISGKIVDTSAFFLDLIYWKKLLNFPTYFLIVFSKLPAISFVSLLAFLWFWISSLMRKSVTSFLIICSNISSLA